MHLYLCSSVYVNLMYWVCEVRGRRRGRIVYVSRRRTAVIVTGFTQHQNHWQTQTEIERGRKERGE